MIQLLSWGINVSEVLSRETGYLLRDIVLYLSNQWAYPLYNTMVSMGLQQPAVSHHVLRDAEKMFCALVESINWDDRDSILPLVKIFENSISDHRATKAYKEFGNKINSHLEKDGFVIKQGLIYRKRSKPN